MKFKFYFSKALYTLVIAGLSCALVPAYAGSYEDFFVAIRNDNAGAISDLLKRGFDPNTPDATGQPGLTIAVREHSIKAARALLSSPDANVDVPNAVGETPLMIAALKGEIAGVTLLLDKGAKVSKPGWTPLHYAATGPEPKLVAMLLDRGADIEALSPNGTTPLMMAAQYGPEDSVTLLLARGADPKKRNQLDLSAVDFAKRSGREPVVKRVEQAIR